MNVNKEIPVFHVRSSRAIIVDAYRLYTAHFRYLLRSAWPVLLLYALTVGGMSTLWIARVPQIMIASATGLVSGSFIAEAATTMLWLAASGIFFILIASVLASYAIALFTKHQAGESLSTPIPWFGQHSLGLIGKTILAEVWIGLIYIIVSGLLCALTWVAFHVLGHYAAIIFSSMLAIAMIILLIPVSYSLMKYLLTPHSQFWTVLPKTYALGFNHLGMLFGVELVVGAITMMLMLFIQLPANILYLANLQAWLGALQGDPLGMPTYMKYLNMAVFTGAGFIQGCVHLSTLFPFYYAYGSIEQLNKERQALK